MVSELKKRSTTKLVKGRSVKKKELGSTRDKNPFKQPRKNRPAVDFAERNSEGPEGGPAEERTKRRETVPLHSRLLETKPVESARPEGQRKGRGFQPLLISGEDSEKSRARDRRENKPEKNVGNG